MKFSLKKRSGFSLLWTTVENREKNNKTIYKVKMIYGNKDKSEEVHVRWDEIIPNVIMRKKVKLIE